MHSKQPKLEITYPTIWSYKIIGEDEFALREAATEIATPRSHSIALSKASATKRYVSLALEVEVEDEAARVGIFERLQASEAVKFVL